MLTLGFEPTTFFHEKLTLEIEPTTFSMKSSHWDLNPQLFPENTHVLVISSKYIFWTKILTIVTVCSSRPHFPIALIYSLQSVIDRSGAHQTLEEQSPLHENLVNFLF